MARGSRQFGCKQPWVTPSFAILSEMLFYGLQAKYVPPKLSTRRHFSPAPFVDLGSQAIYNQKWMNQKYMNGHFVSYSIQACWSRLAPRRWKRMYLLFVGHSLSNLWEKNKHNFTIAARPHKIQHSEETKVPSFVSRMAYIHTYIKLKFQAGAVNSSIWVSQSLPPSGCHSYSSESPHG